MSPAEAERFLNDYKKILKSWVMASTGFSREDESKLRVALDDGLPVLSEIINEFPEMADRAEMLLQARRRADSEGSDAS